MKKKNVNGFTLVELIVILVILAILAAMLVPTLIGFIDKANEKKLIAACRSCVIASQNLLVEEYAKSEKLELPEDKVLALAELNSANYSVDYTQFTGKAILMHFVLLSEGKYVLYCHDGGCTECGSTAAYVVLKSAPSVGYQANANSAFGSIAQVFKDKNYSGGIDGIMASDPSTKAYQIYNSLTPQQQAFLDNVSWSIAKTKPEGSETEVYRIYFTTKDYGTQSAENVKVYKYNIDTGMYQYVTNGRVQNGKVSVSGGPWRGDEDGNEWSETIN